MADNLDKSNIFSCNGAKYLLKISLYCNTNINQQIHALNNQDITMFEYVNEANKLYLDATLTYTDRYGIVDKYIHKQYAYADVLFCKFDSEDGVEIGAGRLIEDQSIAHKFFISSIQILNRINNVIQYKISLVSCNWINCIANLTYSNYGKPPESTLELIKKMLSMNGLTIDPETFGKVQSQVRLNYITNGNENVLTAVKYLLARQYYYQKKDDSFKFIFYHEVDNKYCVYDLKDIETIKTSEQILISLFNTQNETLLSQQPLSLAAVTKFPTSNLFMGLFDKKVQDYDQQHDKFVDKPVKEKDLLDIYNKHFPLTDYVDRFEERFSSTLKYQTRTTFWNSATLENIYSNMMRTFTQDNTLVINTNGNISRKPSSIIMINVDRQAQMEKGDDSESKDEIIKRYKAFEGHWLVVRTHQMISPASSDKSYRQNLVLTRNFVLKDTNENAALA